MAGEAATTDGYILVGEDDRGAVDTPADARRFLEIVARQANRLNSIVEDLLLLCELEQQGQSILEDNAGEMRS